MLEVTWFWDSKVKVTGSITLHNDTSFQTTIVLHSHSLPVLVAILTGAVRRGFEFKYILVIINEKIRVVVVVGIAVVVVTVVVVVQILINTIRFGSKFLVGIVVVVTH